MIRRTLLAGMAAVSAGPAFAQVATTATPGVVQVRMTTTLGPLLLELAGDKAPLTVANFLRYVDAGLYNRSEFYRGVTAPGNVELGLVQGGARLVAGKQIPPVMHEPTTLTGLKHEDGTLSMARGALNSATSDFFVCVGPAHYLDANPEATGPGDHQGFAAFGRVLEGMDVIRRILVAPKSDVAENPTMVGQMLASPVPILTTVRI